MLSVVLRPNTEPVDTESAEEKWGKVRLDLKMLQDKAVRLVLRRMTSLKQPTFAFTWHDDKGTLGLHGNQTGAEDAGRVSRRDATHPTGLL